MYTVLILHENYHCGALQLELCDISDLTTDYLFQQLHPEAVASASKKSFARPKAPSTRGPRRLLKAADNPDE